MTLKRSGGGSRGAGGAGAETLSPAQTGEKNRGVRAWSAQTETRGAGERTVEYLGAKKGKKRGARGGEEMRGAAMQAAPGERIVEYLGAKKRAAKSAGSGDARGAPEERQTGTRVEYDGAGRKRAERPRVRVTEQALAEAALSYLNRRDATAAKLKTHLRGWVRKRGELSGVAGGRESGRENESALDVGALIESVVARLTASRVIDDERYVGNAVRSLRARGASTRAIRFKLGVQGVGEQLVDGAMQAERGGSERGSGSGDAELEAARTFVRKKRLGPHRKVEEREEKRRKDLAALARAGFSFDVARRALGGAGDDEDFF